jgi:subtilisin family serine protease
MEILMKLTFLRLFSLLITLSLLITPVSAQPDWDLTESQRSTNNTLNFSANGKIDPVVLDEIHSQGSTDFFIWMVEQADVSQARNLPTKLEKGEFVFETLFNFAEQSQKDLRAFLDTQGADYQPFYIANLVHVKSGSQQLLLDIAARPDVDAILPNRQFQLQEPFIDDPDPPQTLAVETNITFIKATDVWALGYTGQGTVLAGGDTGLQWDHPAIIDHYRGWNGATANHNYNWWDATGTYPLVPTDGHGHGTHISGTMVGDDGGTNQIGVAPGAQVIHCKNMTDGGSGNDATFITCFEWVLAPWDLNGENPLPSMAPHAMNNSWGYWGGGQPQFITIIENLHAAGILVEVSAGNEGPSCGTLRSPGDYEQVLTTGSVSHAGGVLPGTISSFSSRGPSSLYPDDYFPDIMAPGENIRSSLPGNNYASWSGTSMAGPHTAALVGLMWSANPALTGFVEETIQIIKDTAVPLTGQGGSNCGGDYDTGPNNDWGYGTIDALAAVNAAIDFSDIGTLEGTVTEAGSGDPIEGATILATGPFNRSATTNADGEYSLLALAGTYNVTVIKYGYMSQTVTDVEILEDETEVLDFILELADTYTVSGTVTDINTGWPLYARIDITDFPLSPVWTDPETGEYSAELVGGLEYTFHVDAWVDGYLNVSRAVGPLDNNTVEDFALDVDGFSCTAPGYSLDYLYHENFVADDGGFTLEGANPAPWQWGTPVTWPGECVDGSTCWGTNLTGNYNHNANQSIVSPVIDLSGVAPGMQLTTRWYQANHIENYTWDKAYAEVSIGGGAWQIMWQNPSATIQEDWRDLNYDISAAAGTDVQFRWRFTSDGSVNYAGLYVDRVIITEETACQPEAGGLIVGNVYDGNTGNGMIGASVSSDKGYATSTVAIPLDENVNDGFYTLFAPEGANELTVSVSGNYGVGSAIVIADDGETIKQDFFLPAGIIEAHPEALEVTLAMGSTFTLPMELINSGGLDAEFEIVEIDEGFNPLTAIAGGSWSYTSAAEVGPLSVRSPEGRQSLAADFIGEIAWTGAASLPAGDGVVRYSHAQCSDDPESFYVISGVNEAFNITNKAWLYDAITDEWSQLANIPTGQEGPSAVCHDGYIYVLGGGGTNQFFIYDIAADDWSPAPALPRNVWGAAVGIYAGYLYMIGGDNDFSFGGISNQVNIYDINAGSWISTGTVMPTAAVSAGFAQAGQYLYVVGGWGDASPGQNVDQTQRYDMASDDWDLGPIFTSARADLPLPITGTYLYAIGGDAPGGGAFDATSVVEKLDHTTFPGGSWESATSLPGPLTAHKGGFCTETFTGGEVWSTGGYTGASVVGTNQYEPAEACFSYSEDVPWLSTDPTSGIVPAMDSQIIDVIFDASVPEVDQPGEYTAILRFMNDTPYGHLDIPVTMTVIADADYGVELDPTEADQSGDPGETVEYSLTLTNTGNVTDIVSITATGNQWGVQLSETLFLLQPGESVGLSVQVEIPPDAFGGASDTVIIIAISGWDISVTSISLLTTSTPLNFIYMPVVSRN